MDSQIELLSGSKFAEKPLPSTVYNLANTDFARGHCTEAVKGFESYIKQFPKGEKVPEAKLKMGDCYNQKNNPSAAVQLFDEVVHQFPKDPLVPSALLKEANGLSAMGERSRAKELYLRIIKSYPYTPESKTAQDRLRPPPSNNNSQ
jgi:tol-pal system protein YbgF